MDQPRPFDQQRRVNRRSRMSGACAFAPTRQQQLGPVLFPPTMALGVEFPKLARLWVDGPRTPGQQRDFLMEDPSPKSLEETPLPNPKPPLLASPLPTLAPADVDQPILLPRGNSCSWMSGGRQFWKEISFSRGVTGLVQLFYGHA